MRIIAAYLLAVLGGKSSPTTEDIKSILDSVGVATDTDRADKLVAELSGKNVWEIVEAGKAKLSSVPSTVAAPAASSAAAPAAGGEKKVEEVKKKDEDEEEADADMGGTDSPNNSDQCVTKGPGRPKSLVY